MPFIRVNGVDIHVQEMGRGPAVFLVHGLLLDNLASWYLTVAPRLAASRRVVTYDLRGHGLSQRVASGYDSAGQALDLAEVVDTLAPGEVVDLIGASYGGLIALRCALARPWSFRRLVLVDAPLPPRRYPEIDAYLEADVETLVGALPVRLRAEVLQSKRRAARLARSVGYLVRKTSLIDDIRGEEEIPAPLFAGFELPVLGIYGADSPFRADAARLAAHLPNVELAVVAGGHRLLNESPGEVAAKVTEFLDA